MDEAEAGRTEGSGTLGEAAFELVSRDLGQSFRWYIHDYPYPLARWNYHPEFELHLITRGSGLMFVGDYIGEYGDGNLCLTGANLPHIWLESARDRVISGRDVVLQFQPELFEAGAEVFSEIEGVTSLMERASRGIMFHDAVAREGGKLICAMGQTKGLTRLGRFFELIDMLAHTNEYSVLASLNYDPDLNSRSMISIQDVLAYVTDNIGGEIRQSEAAKIAGMSDSAFSRLFKRNTGKTFVQYVNHLRIDMVCRRLRETDMPITEICFQSGYNNISNFNRKFLAVCNMTPRVYRALARS